MLTGNDEVYPVTVGDTPTLFVNLEHDRGDLTLTLSDPTGALITPTTTDPNIFYTSTLTQTLYTVANPPAGDWQVTVGNLTGSENYLLNVLGAPVLPTLETPTLTPISEGYEITVQATGAPTATYSLFYDDDDTGNDGKPIATRLPLSQTSVEWDTSTVPEGTYYVYALVDDPFNAPVVAYSDTSITIVDDTPPDAPINLQVTTTGSNATFTWQPSMVPDVAGYRIYIDEPNGASFIADVPNGQQSSYTHQGLYVSGGWTASIVAYDINNNESALSTEVTATINLNTQNLYLPLVIR